MNKQSFVFYETFYEQLQDLDEKTQLKFYNCITAYGLFGKEPENLNPLENALWKTFKFAIDSAKERRAKNIENGKKGGRPTKVKTFEVEYKVKEVGHKEAKIEKPKITQNNRKKPKANLNVNVNANDNVNDDVILTDIFTNNEIHNEILNDNDILNLNEIQQNNDIPSSKLYCNNDCTNSYDIQNDISDNLEFKTKFQESSDHYIYIVEEKNEKQKNIRRNKTQIQNFDTSQTKDRPHFVDKKNIFKKPSIKEIQSYCNFRKNNIDANVFFDFYESVGWHVGKNDMYDWRATIRVWEYRNKQKIKLHENQKKEPVVEKTNCCSTAEELEKFFGMPVEQHNDLVMAECYANFTDEKGAELLDITVEEYRTRMYGDMAQ